MSTKLTRAEKEVLAAVIGGNSNREIARARKTSTGTVANQVTAILRKLGARSRSELVRAVTGTTPAEKVPRR